MKNALLILLLSLFLIACKTTPEEINYGSHQGKQVSIRNTKIYYEEYGEGTPLLLLSGGGLTRSIKDFEKCIPELARHYRLIAPDAPGQGRSELPDTLNYQILNEFMSDFIDSLKVDSIYVMGWSDGGITGILLAEARPDKVRKVIAVGPNNGTKGFFLPPGIPLDSVHPPSMEYVEANRKADIDRYMATLPRDWKRLIGFHNSMWYAEKYFPDSIYSRIQIPVMIVLGDRDEITVEHGLEMQKLIKGSQYCVLPNTTHDVFSEKPELINRIAIEFFR